MTIVTITALSIFMECPISDHQASKSDIMMMAYTNFQIHQARQFPVKVGKTVHSNVTAQPSTLAVSRNALRNIPKAPFQSLGIE